MAQKLNDKTVVVLTMEKLKEIATIFDEFDQLSDDTMITMAIDKKTMNVNLFEANIDGEYRNFDHLYHNRKSGHSWRLDDIKDAAHD